MNAPGKAPFTVIVGAGQGLGLAITRRFARAGLELAVLVRDESDLAEFQKSLGSLCERVRLCACDVGDPGALSRTLGAALEGRPVPEVLVYNASTLRESPPSRLDPGELLQDFRTNCASALQCAQAVLPGMKDRGSGTLLFTGGGLALKPNLSLASLSLGKGALRTLALLLAEELAPSGIHVATVTVAGFIQPGTPLDPDLIAEEFWRLHAEPPGFWTREVVLPPAP